VDRHRAVRALEATHVEPVDARAVAAILKRVVPAYWILAIILWLLALRWIARCGALCAALLRGRGARHGIALSVACALGALAGSAIVGPIRSVATPEWAEHLPLHAQLTAEERPGRPCGFLGWIDEWTVRMDASELAEYTQAHGLECDGARCCRTRLHADSVPTYLCATRRGVHVDIERGACGTPDSPTLRD
jgi:hypothetical protein